MIRLFQSDKICVYFVIIENCCNSQFPHITMIFFGCQSNQCRRAFMNFKFCNCTWQCSKIRGTFLFRFSEYLTSGYISAGADFIQAVVTLTNSDTHAQTLHVEFRILSWREIPPSPRYFHEYPSIRQSDSQSLLSSRDKDRNVLPWSERDGRENCHWFCCKCTRCRMSRGLPASHVLVKSYRVSVPIEECLRKIGDVRKLRTGKKSKSKSGESKKEIDNVVKCVVRSRQPSAPLGIRDEGGRVRTRRNYILTASFVRSGRDY